jgi:hypothetical protein
MSNELYLFNDNGVYYGFSPTITSKTFLGQAYKPTIIIRSGLSLTDNLAKSPLTFKFERTHSYARQLLSELPEVPILVTVYRNSLPYWRGRVINAKGSLLYIEVQCESIYSSMVSAGKRARIQLTCRHMLYSTGCNVLESNFEYLGTTTATTSNLTVTGISWARNGFFTGGKCKMGEYVRHILSHTGYNIVLATPFPIELTGTIKLYPGCNLTETRCAEFNNLVNFGGFSRMPGNNPFSSTGLL